MERIGGTPLLPLPSPREGVRVLGKAEWMNPGGSVKDRTAWSIVRGALERGDLVARRAWTEVPGPSDGRSDRPNGSRPPPAPRLLDASSGNTAIAYAMLGAALGFGVTLCLPENASRERRLTLAAYGAEVVLTDEMEGTDGAADMARDMAEREPDRFWYADQYGNPDNWRAHYEGTAAEIWEQTGGSITHLVAGLGTTGTLVGSARRLRELAPGVRVVAVEPDAPMHGLEGLKHLPTARTPDIYDPSLIDERLRISTDEARRAASELAEEAGLFVGPSAGAACAAARRVAAGLESGTVVTVLPDGGARYLSEAWWTDREHPAAGRPVAGGSPERPSPEASLIVARPLLDALHRGLEAAYPGEGCGVLLGEVDGATRIVREVVPAENRSGERNDRYEVDPEVLRELVAAEDRGGPTVLGFFHSHPNVDPVPSATDRGRAWPWYVYLIVRVRESGAAEGRVWTFGTDGEPAEGTLSVRDASDGAAPGLADAPRGTTASAGDIGLREET